VAGGHSGWQHCGWCSLLTDSANTDAKHFIAKLSKNVSIVALLIGLAAKYDDHLKFIGKRVVDFILVLIELFSLGVTVKALRAKIGRKSTISLQHGHFDPKFQVEGVALTNHFCTDN